MSGGAHCREAIVDPMHRVAPVGFAQKGRVANRPAR